MASDPTSSAGPAPAPDIKTHSSPAAFPTTLSLSLFPSPLSLSLFPSPLSLSLFPSPLSLSLFPSPLSLSLFPSPLSPSCTNPPRSSGHTELHFLPYQRLIPTGPIRHGQWEKCRSATADSYSLDVSAALSHRPSDPGVDP